METHIIKQESRVLNIPTKLVKDYLSNKETNLLLMFYICIKAKYPDSRMPKFTVDEVQHLTHCKRDDARYIVNTIKGNKFNNWFKYRLKNNSLIAINTKKKYTKRLIDKKGRDIWCINVLKLPIYKLNNNSFTYEKIEFSFRHLKKELRKLLLMDAICKYTGKDKCNKYKNNLFVPTYKQMCKPIGVTSPRTINRLLKEMEEENLIRKIEDAHLSYIDNYRSSGTEAVMEKSKNRHGIVVDKRTGSVYEARPNVYRLTGIGLAQPRFIMLNHTKRMTQYLSKNNDCLFDCWDR